MKPSAFAYCCFQILVETGQAVYELPPFHKTIISKYPKDMEESHVILPGEIINLIYQHFRDWFLLRENIYDGPRLFEMRRDFQNQNILDPHYKIGNYQLPSFLEKLQSHVAEWLIFWQSPIVKAKIVMLEKVHEMLEQVSNPTILEETRCHIGTLSKAYSLPAQRIPEWQDCHQLLKDFNKKWAQLLPIHRFQFMDLEKNPLYIHRCLILIRILEDKDNYNLFQFEQYISSIANYVEAQHAAIKKSVVEKHLACYSDWSIELNESIKCGPYISMLQSIVGKAISLVSICSRIDFLIAIQPYVKDDFVENAKRVSNALSSIPSSSVPGEARSSIVKTIKYCTRYISLVQSLNTAEAKNEGIPEWQRASEKLSNISLLTDLKLLCRQLHLTYRIRLLVISTILPDETIFTPTLSLELNIINSLDSALDLVNKLDEAIQALPTMDYIMSTVSPQTTQEVKDFLVSLLLGSSFNSPIELLSHETLSAIQQLYPRLYAALQVSITAGKPMPW